MLHQTTDLVANFRNNKKLEVQMIEVARPLLEELFGPLKRGTIFQDSQQGADLLTTDERISIGVRSRSHDALKWKNDLTIRSAHKKSDRCELDKLKEGKPTYIFQCFASADRKSIQYWRLLSVDCLARGLKENHYPSKLNADGTGFIILDIAQLQKTYPGIVILEKEDQ